MTRSKNGIASVCRPATGADEEQEPGCPDHGDDRFFSKRCLMLHAVGGSESLGSAGDAGDALSESQIVMDVVG